MQTLNKNGSFQVITVLISGNIGKFSDIVLDSQNYIHIVCYNEKNEKII
ncbi:MAG: hypothetical protein N3A58_07365 [Spirochaetes bacterium]|nr:hypothetical protein [Spirochaetota bacterium]